jgi:hypothetical protein
MAMKAFKTVRDFAAKDQTVPDSQKEWQQWKQKINKPNTSEDDEEEAKHSQDDASYKRVKQTEQGEDENIVNWTELTDTEGKSYWVDGSSGKTTRTNPFDSVLKDSDSEDVFEKQQNNITDATATVSPQLPPQEWEKKLHPLTRKSYWYCPELDATCDKEPLSHPWRGVLDDKHRLYFWNPTTNETKWP